MMPRTLDTPGLRRRAAALVIGAALALSGAGLAAPAVAAEPEHGALTAGDTVYPNVGNGGYDALHYDVSITYDPATNRMDSQTTLRARTERTLASFALDLKDLTVDAVTVDGEPAAFTRIHDDQAISYKLVITPAEPVTGEFEAVIDYSGEPNHFVDPDGSWEGWVRTDDGATAVNEPVGAMTWYPNNNTPTDKATHRFTIDIPSQNQAGKALAAASNGVLTSKASYSSGGVERTRWVWNQPVQQATYLSLVSIGSYRVYENDIELLNGRTVREWSFIDTEITGTQLTTTLNNRARMQEIMQWMESRYGPYPGVSAGIVVDRTSLGYALETQDRSYFERSVSFNTLVHEIGHQWFGNSVSPGDWSDIWLNEGPATYLPMAFAYDKGENASPPVARLRSSWNSRAANHASWAIPPKISDPAQLFNNWSVYQRPGQMLGAMEDILGTARFDAFMVEWHARFAGSHASQEDFFALATELSGLDFAPFGQAWVNAPAKPDWPAAPDRHVLRPVSEPTLGISGPGRVGGTLTASLTGWPSALDDVTIAWYVDGEEVPGADGETFDLTVDHLDKVIGVSASAENPRVAPLTEFTQRRAPVTEGSLSKPARPRISGTPVVGGALEAVLSDWDSANTASYQWLRNGDAIPGAVSRSYRPVSADAGRRLSLRVTASRDGYHPASSTSDPTVRVALRKLQRTPAPVIRGKAAPGRTLSVKTGRWDSGVKLGYRWQVNGRYVGTKSTYKVKKSDAGKRVRVTVTGTKKDFASVSKQSTRVRIAKR
ncbi:M1 family metallopeptidase [Leucobacter weissii]|uniref:Aminopeptidase N n=1 Tax=Leucobacter weissii TaxID=1983706 RepID=A0A939MIJ9_9MICO|nr:M1 family aminopeptidase [Leucobacter weissii]MBO1901574.1 M1 family metallopeptidase [Leucobacter weissii]